MLNLNVLLLTAIALVPSVGLYQLVKLVLRVRAVEKAEKKQRGEAWRKLVSEEADKAMSSGTFIPFRILTPEPDMSDWTEIEKELWSLLDNKPAGYSESHVVYRLCADPHETSVCLTVVESGVRYAFRGREAVILDNYALKNKIKRVCSQQGRNRDNEIAASTLDAVKKLNQSLKGA